MNFKITKKDLFMAALAGELSAWLSFPILKNLKVFNMLAERGIDAIGFSVFWVLFVPAGAVAALSFFYFLATYKNRIGFFELGKYGIIGVLNTFLDAGVYNILIFVTDIASGFMVNIFFIVAFAITVINSFFWNKFWTFTGSKEASAHALKEEEIKKTGVEAIKFFATSSVVALINAIILHIIINIIGAPAHIDPKIWANVALGFTIITAFLGNFFSYKYIVFSGKK